MTLRRLALAAALALAAVLVGRAALADRMKLWEIVHDQCAPAAEKGAKMPPPCLQVDAKAGEAVIKDRNGVAQLLAIPTARVTGIEDPVLLAPGVPPYFAQAWAARGLMAAYLKRPPPREAIALAVNSEYSRSQDQLHIHVDCLRRDVAQALAAYAPHIDGQWRAMTEALAGRNYFVRRVESADLVGVDPFRLLAEGMPKAKSDMGHWSLAAVPLRFGDAPGFALLADHAELTAGGHAEDLQDHDCALAK